VTGCTPIDITRVAALLLLGALAPAHAGVLIERVMPQSAGAMAGLRAGDEIVSLSAAPGQVEQLDSSVDLLRAELNYSYRVPVTVTVVTSGKTAARTIPTGTWGLHVQPTAVTDPGDEPIAAIMRGASAFEQFHLDRALEAWLQAQSLLGTATSTLWLRALVLVRLAEVAILKGDLARAQGLVDEALSMLSTSAPSSLAVADAKRVLATVHHERRELDAARVLLQEALALVDPLPRNNLVWVDIQVKLAHLEKLVGPLDGAASDLNAAYELAKALKPRSVLVTRLLTTLGARALDEGDFALAEELIGQALAIAREVAPGTIAEGGNLMNLGNVYLKRHDYAAAQRAYEKAAAIFEQVSPGSPAALRALSNVAMAAGAADAPQQAIAVLERVLAIQQRAQPDSLDSAHSYNALGLNYQRAREPQRALHAFERSLAIKERHSPNAMATGIAHENLGMALRSVGRLDAAAGHHRLALRIFRRTTPGTAHEAESLHSLGLIERERNRDSALQYFSQAIHAIEQQERRLGGSREVRAGFAAYYSAFYKDYMELLLQAGREEEAFEVLERYRARVLTAMRAERLAPANTAKRSEPVLTAREVSAKLPPRSVLLSYSVGERDLRIFAIRSAQQLEGKNAPALRVLRIPVAAAQLQHEIAAWRDLLRSPAAARPGSPEAQDFGRHARRLREWLLDGADEVLAETDHWIVVADGPLHLLPLTALPAAAGGGSQSDYVTQRVRVTTAISATLYLAESPSRRSTARILAFGDPAYPQTDRPQLRRLEGTQVELRSIRRIYGVDAQIYSGAEATERRAQAIPPQTLYLHYAVHGVLDDRAPFDSYLAFVPERDAGQARTTPTPGDRDGRLQAWEIAANMRLTAELVVLSSCDTALGMDAAGEGLMGLTRAFQYAGAGAVLASLWEAPDRSTSMFMTELHRRIRAGEPVERALQATQQRFISDPAFRIWSHPVHWAGFQVSAARPGSY
jgi:CHAT domain-containing protein/tetratricopeptide (TPR) repeat protein